MQEVSRQSPLELVMEWLVAKVAQAFVTTGFLAAFALVYSLPGGLANGRQLIGDAADVTGATGHVIKENQCRRQVIGVAIERAIQVVAANAQRLACPFQQRIEQREPVFILWCCGEEPLESNFQNVGDEFVSQMVGVE